MKRHDVLVVGGGLAGLRAALGLCGRCDVAVVSSVHPVRAHSGSAQGGINAALQNAPDGRDDSPQRHAFDTIRGSDYLADQPAVMKMCALAPEAIFELERWGAPFSRFPDGTIAQRPFGGAGYPRSCYAADLTGHVLLQTLYEQAVRRGITVYDERVMVALVVADGRYHGLIVLNQKQGQLEALTSRFCVLATGGYGRIYRNSTNSLINTGSGIGAALLAGIPLKDMEFVQFHPTTQFGTNILISEAARGEGGYLLNRDGARFMQSYAPKHLELAPRDIVARAIQREIDEGRGFAGGYVLLDIRHLGRRKILKRLPSIRGICLDFAGLDPIHEPIPVQPGQHYSMGGIDTDVHGRTCVPNLYAAGEAACVNVHGANRLGGNSLLDTVVFGRLVADDISLQGPATSAEPDEAIVRDALDRQTRHVQELLGRPCGVPQHRIRQRLQAICTDRLGILRHERGLRAALEELGELQEQYRHVACRTPLGPYHGEIVKVLELEGSLLMAQITAAGALARQESRGAHFRTDYPQRDDQQWLKHTIIQRAGARLRISYRAVEITEHEPQERTY